MQNLERCSKCVLPITWETLYFDKKGICNICHNWKQKEETTNWIKREKDLVKIFETVKKEKHQYDCVVPYSGGKDSTFTLWSIVRKYQLKPLVVSFDHGFYRPRTIENRTRTFKKLGVDVITFTPNWQIVKKLMLETLIRKGDFWWHSHCGIYAYPMQIAVKFEIPLVIWGEGGGEYEGYFKFADLEQTDEWKFNRRIILGMRAEDLAGFINVEPRDLAPYIYPTKQEIEQAGVRSLPLGKYISWDVQKQVKINKKELGWQEDETETGYPGITYEKIECMFEGMRDYIKYLKRGFSRMTHLATLDIRHGRITREQALKMIEKNEGKKPQSLKVFLEYIGISEDDFNDIVSKHLIPPAKLINPAKLKSGKQLWDQKLWYREDNRRIKNN